MSDIPLALVSECGLLGVSLSAVDTRAAFTHSSTPCIFSVCMFARVCMCVCMHVCVCGGVHVHLRLDMPVFGWERVLSIHLLWDDFFDSSC